MSTASIVIIIVNILLAKILSVGTTPIMVWWERRVAGLMQDRAGPNRADIAGIRLGGLIQAIADMLKLIFKEDFTPAHIKYKFLYTIAPAIVFMASFLSMAVIPFADTLVIDNESFVMQAIPTNLGIMWFLAFAGLSVFGIILGGYASENKYGLLGGIRASAQVISYEAAMALSIISILLTYGSIDLSDMVRAQSGTFFGIIPAWGIFMQPLAALIFIVTAFAETNRTPFDIAEGESELVAGYHTEYSAMRFGLFQVGEYAAMSASSAIIVTLFFGGFNIPWVDTQTLQSNMSLIIFVLLIVLPVTTYFLTKWMNKNYNWVDKNDKRQREKNILIRAFWIITALLMLAFVLILIMGLGSNGTNIATAIIQIATFITKFFMMSFVFIWIRWTLLRFRYDQLQMLGWKVLIPLAILNIVITATFIVVTGN
jgi:NADH-quinone oxidoreductase subunit H